MNPENEPKPTCQNVRIENDIPFRGESLESMEIPVEISPDGMTFTAKVVVDGHEGIGIVHKVKDEVPGDAVGAALLDIENRGHNHEWFV
jgi:hypothetical protein